MPRKTLETASLQDKHDKRLNIKKKEQEGYRQSTVLLIAEAGWVKKIKRHGGWEDIRLEHVTGRVCAVEGAG